MAIDLIERSIKFKAVDATTVVDSMEQYIYLTMALACVFT